MHRHPMPAIAGILLCLAMPCIAQEKASVRIKVTDRGGGPIVAAAVIVEKVRQDSNVWSTDENGEVTIEGLQPDNYMLWISNPAFRSRLVPGVELRPGETAKLSVKMEPGHEDLVIEYDKLTEFEIEWYSKSLKAMGEPWLCAEPMDKDTHSYRFLWLRSFHNPVLVKLVIGDDGKGILTTKMTSGQGGYEMGELVLNESREVPAWEVEWFVSFAQEVGFWQLPTRIERNWVTLDGAHWITEGTKDGECHVVDRWSPDEPDEKAYRGLGIAFLIDLAGLELLSKDVY